MRAHLTVFLLAAACSGSSTHKPMPDAPKDVGFTTPTAALEAWDNSGSMPVDKGPADLTCYDTPSTDMATTVAITLNTVVKDFQSHNPVPMAHVIAFDNIDYMHPWDTRDADQNGNITFQVPTGRKRFGFEMTTNDGSTLPTFLLFQYLSPDPTMTTQTIDKIQSVSSATAATLPALIGETRTMGTGVLAGALRDCQHHEMSNFIATVSMTPAVATPLSGAETYYFSPGVDLPVHHSQQDASSSDGLFMAIQLPPTTTAYVQMWGFANAADLAAGNLKLISELQVPVLPDTVITGSYEPLRQ